MRILGYFWLGLYVTVLDYHGQVNFGFRWPYGMCCNSVATVGSSSPFSRWRRRQYSISSENMDTAPPSPSIIIDLTTAACRRATPGRIARHHLRMAGIHSTTRRTCNNPLDSVRDGMTTDEVDSCLCMEKGKEIGILPNYDSVVSDPPSYDTSLKLYPSLLQSYA